MVARDLRPAALVEGGGFKDLIKCIESDYKVPTATHISEAGRKKYVAAKGSLKVKLQDAKSLGITTISGQAVPMMPLFQSLLTSLQIVGSWYLAS